MKFLKYKGGWTCCEQENKFTMNGTGVLADHVDFRQQDPQDLHDFEKEVIGYLFKHFEQSFQY